MEELVQDLVSALEQTSEQAELDDLWQEMVLRPLQHRRQVRRRRGRKRRCDFEHSLCLSEASESSLDESFTREHRHGAGGAVAVAAAPMLAANHSDSDDTLIVKRWTPSSLSFRTRQHSWPESDSFTENTPGRLPRRRRKVKRMPPNVNVNVQQRFRVCGLERGEQTHRHCHHHPNHSHQHQRSYKKQRLSRLKKRSGGWSKQDGVSVGTGVGGMSQECWKDKILRQTKEKKEASDENIETSSVCSSDPGLFTNDEGRQGDDEQSDWFFEGDCASGIGVQGLISGRESETAPRPAALDSKREKHHSPTFLHPSQPSQRGYHARINRLPGVTACCIRKGRRRLPAKDNNIAACVDKLRNYSHDSYQRELWLPPYGKQDRRQLKPLCSLSMYPLGIGPDTSHPRCSISECKNRQRSAHLGVLCGGDIKRRRKTVAISSATSVYLPFRREDANQCCETPFSPGGDGALSLPSTSHTPDFIKPGTSFSSQREHEYD
ncbi:G patch domain-containing protein 2-like isoform X2 [Silurus meridionalis]|uniref:G patch domain-containing protein 2-like isoform X2 n=1 Tax=Silurus meridionalis TaxID=175797 RepID=UPI001EEBAD12|nr:G patch domain-containing protein 2-like isoform X2 [Silurus meridionalis]